jgi:RHS repeat-associated protein
VTVRSSATGALTYAASYEAYGTRTQEAGANADRQRANTKDEDPTGLLNEGMRYRDLETGLFISRDPMGFVDGPNVYTYVRQNPWTSFDPHGLWIEDAVLGVPSLLLGAKSFYDNVSNGNVGSALVDAAGMIADGAAIATPGLPGGVGLGIKASRVAAGAGKIENAGNVVQGAAATVEAVQNGDGLGAVAAVVQTTAGAKSALPGGKSAKATQEEAQAVAKSTTRGNGGRGGGSDHASVQQNVTDAAGGRQEVPIEGTRRIADNVDEQGKIHQIGDMRHRGGFAPSGRERGAIEDIREGVGPDKTIIYHDKRGVKPSLINPDQQPDWKPAPPRHRKPVEKE